jgi:hypothetical protein
MTARFALVALTALALGALLRSAYASWLLPLWEIETRLVVADMTFGGARIGRRGTDEVIEMRARAVRAVQHEGAVRLAEVRRTASTLVGHAVLHPVLVLSLLALLARDWRHYARLAACALPFIAVLEMLDIPLVLAEQLYIPDIYATGRMDLEPVWSRFLDNGGRYALCVAAAGAACGLHERLARRFGRA